MEGSGAQGPARFFVLLGTRRFSYTFLQLARLVSRPQLLGQGALTVVWPPGEEMEFCGPYTEPGLLDFMSFLEC